MEKIHVFQTIEEYIKGSNVHHLHFFQPDIVVGKFEDIDKVLSSNLEAHRLTFFEINLFFENTKTITQYNQNTFNFSGQVIYTNSPGPLRSWKKNDKWTGYFLFFKPDFLNMGLDNQNIFKEFPFLRHDANPIFQVNETELNLIKELYEKLYFEYTSNKLLNREILRLYLQILLQSIRRLFLQQEQNLQKLEQATGTSRKDMIRAQFEVLIRQNLTEKISIEAYAEQLCISPNYLTKSIKQATGKSPQQLIQEYKIREAEALLVQTDLSVSEIAYYLEFTDPSHFIRVFKTVNIGQTPQAFRASIVQNNESLAK